ncbi:glycosyl hydrolase family 61-domain-containing protein [Russula aff. rugulosa BPL654]|nr:glycosyl hydrolase family 61-domain-containing protein [Russula aff. rugulosa BPL654]
MLPLFIFALSPLFSLLPSVAGHGYVEKVIIDGTTYTGNVPAAQPSDSPIRQISDIGPLATMVVPANPGSVLQFYWGNPGGGNWPHNTGPIMTYMGACDTSTCDKFNGSTAKWFKIDQIGKKSDGNTWYQQDIMNAQPASLTLPTEVAPGDYLVRHEIIALHLAVTLGGAEFYPSCTQIRVGGSQTGTPNATVSFPGAYNDNDPGIYDPSIYTPGASYTFPGGPVSNLASPADMTGQLSGNGSSSSPAGNSTSPSTAKNGNPTSTGSGAQPTGIAQSSLSRVCKLQKRNALLSRRDTGVAQHKRHISFMRAIREAFYHS